MYRSEPTCSEVFGFIIINVLMQALLAALIVWVVGVLFGATWVGWHVFVGLYLITWAAKLFDAL